MAAGRVLNKDLDARLKAVEDRLCELVEGLKRLEEQAGAAQAEAQAASSRSAEAAAAANRIAEAQAVARHAANGNGSTDDGDKLTRLEAVVGRLDERVEKITHTLVQQAHRFS
jgi:chromosome segregation ATPase